MRESTTLHSRFKDTEMQFKFKARQAAVALAVATVATVASAATSIQLDAPITVSTTDPANNAYKAKMGWISYKSSAVAMPAYDVKAQIMVYADGAPGAQNIWVARSTDNGATWSQQKVTTNGGTALTGTASAYVASNNKPNIYVAPLGVLSGTAPNVVGANALLTWTSTDCTDAGNGASDLAGPATAQLINTTLVPNQPYMCLWTARSTDGGVTWAKQRLTNGSLDADEDVPAGYVKYTSDVASTGGFAITYQADPAGLKPGEAEGPGDGASGAAVNPGTNIWYTFLSKAAFQAKTAFPTPTAISNNTGTASGDPGASRANLNISGGTAVLAYEETKGGGSPGKQIIYHSFPYATPDTNSAGTPISNPSNNARRVRFLLQGNEAMAGAGDANSGLTKGVHVLLVWRETSLTTPAAASDIMMSRGIRHTGLRPGSTGFLPTDIEPFSSAKNLSDPTNANIDDNALAQRGVLRGEFAAIAYDHTGSQTQANLYNDTYNLFITSTSDGGDTWGAARNMSNLASNALRVVEPRLVGTPGTIKLPDGVTATSDLSDVQNPNVLFVSWGTETNAAVSVPQDIYLTRSTDKGATYEAVQLLAGDNGATVRASETQLRAPPDGKTLGALWMQSDAAGTITDVIYRNGIEVFAIDDSGLLTVTKTITPATPSATGSFPFTVNCSAPVATYNGVVNVASGNTGSTTVNIPAGSTNCAVIETLATRAAAPAGYAWGAPSVSAIAVPVGATATASSTITNPLQSGSLSINYSVSIPLPAAATINFTVSCVAPNTTPATIALGAAVSTNQTISLAASASSGSVTVGPIAAGSICSVTETAPTAIPNYKWGTTPAATTGLVIANSGTPTAVPVTNVLTPLDPPFISKRSRLIDSTTVEWSITVINNSATNAGQGPVSFTVTDAIPGNAVIAAGSLSCTPTGTPGQTAVGCGFNGGNTALSVTGTLAYTVDTNAATASQRVDIVFRARVTAGDVITNTACADLQNVGDAPVCAQSVISSVIPTVGLPVPTLDSRALVALMLAMLLAAAALAMPAHKRRRSQPNHSIGQ